MEKLKHNISKGISKIKHYIKKDELEEAKNYVSISLNYFKDHFFNFSYSFKADIEKCKTCKIKPNYRDFLWLFFLDILPYNSPEEWKQILTDLRSDYLEYKTTFITKEIKEFILLKDEEEKGSIDYDKYQKILEESDYNLLDLIKIDIKRTFQEIEIFLMEKYKRILVTVLFVFAKKNKEIGYKQGMNEIAGIFLFVLYKQYQLKNAFIKDDYSFLFYIFHSNNEFIENDLYIMFSFFMKKKGVGKFYNYNSPVYKNNFLSKKNWKEKKNLTIDEIDGCEDSVIKKRIFKVYYKFFEKVDQEFYEFLIRKVEPEFFLFKWYLCVFSREFDINKVVHLWDLILCFDFVKKTVNKNKIENLIGKGIGNVTIDIDGNGNNDAKIKNFRFNEDLCFMDVITLSMISLCKNDVISKQEDESELLKTLMHYPDKIKVEDVCSKALEINSLLYPDDNF